MPELPEVQTVVSQLAAKVAGFQVVGFESAWPKAVRPNVEEFILRTMGGTIVGVRRFGKHIVIDLESAFPLASVEEEYSERKARDARVRLAYSIVIHLKMTGHLLVKTPENEGASHFVEDKYNGYIRHTIYFSGGTRIEFSDLRKFGWLEVVPTEEVDQMASIQSLGVDALSDQFTPRYLREVLEKRSRSVVGVVLLEQHLIAGIGNIYRNEALYRSGILPIRAAGTLSDAEVERLHGAIRDVLTEAVLYRGMSDGDFRDTDGLMGSFEETAYVYGREGDKCKGCGTIIMRAKLGQRSVFFCPQCQE